MFFVCSTDDSVTFTQFPFIDRSDNFINTPVVSVAIHPKIPAPQDQ